MDCLIAEKLVLAEYAALCRQLKQTALAPGKASDALERLGFMDGLRLLGNMGDLPEDVADPFYRWQAELFHAKLTGEAVPG